MSVIRRTRGGQEYLYFQYYHEGRKVERYIGPSKAHETWKQWERIRDEYKSSLSDWLQKHMSELDETIAITLGLDRRRLLEAVRPQSGAGKRMIEVPVEFTPATRLLKGPRKPGKRRRKP